MKEFIKILEARPIMTILLYVFILVIGAIVLLVGDSLFGASIVLWTHLS